MISLFFSKNWHQVRLVLGNFFRTFSEIIILAIIFLVPLYFALYFQTADLFELPKLVLFRILVCLLALSGIASFVLTEKKAIVWKNFFSSGFFKAFLFFFLILSLATVFSVNPSLSWQGVYKRYEGLSSQLFYGLFFILTLLFFLDNSENFSQKLKRIWWTITASAFLVSVYGIAQRFGFDFMTWSEPALLTHRTTSTLGQPNFLASFLLFTIPVAVYLVFCSQKFLARFFLGLVLTSQLLCLFFTQSRGGWLGLMMELVVFVFFFRRWIWKFIFKKIKIISLFYCFIVLFFVGFFVFSLHTQFSERISSFLANRNGSADARLVFWQASLEEIAKRPLLGFGLDTQGDLFARHYAKDWAIFGQVNDYPDRAHNFILDLILTGGLLGFFAYVFLLIIFGRALWALIKKENEFYRPALIIFIALVGYLVSLFFSFSIVTTNIYFWFYLALGLAMIFNPSVKIEKEVENNQKKTSKIKTTIITLILLALVGFFGWQIKNNFNWFLADYYAEAMVKARQENDFMSFWQINNLIKEKSAYYYYENFYVLILSGWPEIYSQTLFRQVAVKDLDNFLVNHQKDNYSNIFLRTKILARLAQFDKKYQEQAIDEYSRLLTLSPEMPSVYREYADFLTGQGKNILAKLNYEKALVVLPDLSNPAINQEHAEAIRHEQSLDFQGLGELAFREKAWDLAEEYFRQALRSEPRRSSLYKKIADIYYVRGDFNQAIWYNKVGWSRSRSDYVWPYSIALLYEAKGDLVNARQYADSALQLNSQDQELIDFVDKLKNKEK